MTASTTRLEVDDTLQVAVTDGGSRLAIQLDRDRALQLGSALIEFAMRRPLYQVPEADRGTSPQHGPQR